MQLRTPRYHVKRESYGQEFIKLMHSKMLIILMCIVTVGHLSVSTQFDVKRYVLGMVGVLFAILSAYRVNEIKDRTTTKTTPVSHHWVWAIVFISIAVVISMFIGCIYSAWLICLSVIGVTIMYTYNASHNVLIHNRLVYGLIWGALPLIFSAMLQSLNPIPEPFTLALGAWAFIVAIYTLWLWGTSTCGRSETCRNYWGNMIDKNKRLVAMTRRCHSPVIGCGDRIFMPKDVNDHTKAIINLNVASVVLLTIALYVAKFT